MFHRLMQVFNSAAEAFRSPVELAALYACAPWIKANTPAGTGQPVLVLPGFTGSDSMTAPLRSQLADKGYRVYGWQGGINTGLNPDTITHLVARLKAIHAENGGKKIALVGHSLGGIFARELARDYPDMIDRVITLGSPFGMSDAEAPAMLAQVYKLVNPKGDPTELTDPDLLKRRQTPPPHIPVTSIYSQTDGVVPWRACLNPREALTENIHVPSSHIGMIYHPVAVAAVLDRLAAQPAQWKPFDLAKISPLYAWAANQNQPALPENPQWQASAASRPLFRKR